jgi:hypothetical protein
MFRFHRRLESAFLRDRCHRLSLLRLGASQFARPSRRRRVTLRDERRLGGDASPLRRVSRALGVGDFPRRLSPRVVRGRKLRRARSIRVVLLLEETRLVSLSASPFVSRSRSARTSSSTRRRSRTASSPEAETSGSMRCHPRAAPRHPRGA